MAGENSECAPSELLTQEDADKRAREMLWPTADFEAADTKRYGLEYKDASIVKEPPEGCECVPSDYSKKPIGKITKIEMRDNDLVWKWEPFKHPTLEDEDVEVVPLTSPRSLQNAMEQETRRIAMLDANYFLGYPFTWDDCPHCKERKRKDRLRRRRLLSDGIKAECIDCNAKISWAALKVENSTLKCENINLMKRVVKLEEDLQKIKDDMAALDV